MRVVPINVAEAIIEPFWDGGSSEHPKDKLSLLGNYAISVAPAAHARVSQGWCAVDVHIDSAEPGSPCVVMSRECDLDVSGYNVFRVFASLPSWVRLTVLATVDGAPQVLLDGVAGPDSMAEFDGKLVGRRMTAIRIEFTVTENRVAYVALLWLGLANAALQQRLEARRSPYTSDWPGLLAPEAGRIEPEIGILFARRDLAALRRKVSAGWLKPSFDALRRQAAQDLQLNPEADIGFYVPNPDRRWVRDRDLKRARTTESMERLAFVGLIDGNVEMSRMAARMALSAAHCDTWCESVIGLFPGATWHHRSFTEEVYCRACALVLDWAGYCLTSHAKQVIRDAIVMKGLPRIESDFKRMEYIRHMNQGIVFSSGRIMGALSLLPAYPRYASLIAEAERDLHEMIGSYVQADGGTLEGMAYWNYTFSTAMPLVYALARHHGRTLKEYVSPALVKTGDFALGMLSTVGDGTTYLPVNDAHADQRLSMGVVAAYCQISERPEWRQLYALMSATQTEPNDGPDLFHLVLAPNTMPSASPKATRARPSRVDVFPTTGEASSFRIGTGVGPVLFHLSCGPILNTHYHEDRGSFVLEADGEALAIDRGVTTYDHPEVALIGDASRHNLIYPERDGVICHQPPTAAGGALTSALHMDADLPVALFACDGAAAWEPGLFRSNLRRVVSAQAELFVFDDDVVMARRMAVSFRLHSRCAMEQRPGEVWVMGQRSALRVVPLNWTPAEVTITVEGVDSHLQPVNMLRLVAAPSRQHRLLTAIQVVRLPANETRLWRFEQGPRGLLCSRDEWQVRLAQGQRPALRAEVWRDRARLMSATCATTQWKVAAR